VKEYFNFTEVQRYRQWWIWLSIAVVNTIVFVKVVTGFNAATASFNLLAPILFIVTFDLFFFLVRLETKIDEVGIWIRFFPFHLRFKCISWTTVSKVFVREYNPLFEYGGWGIKYGFTGYGKAYSINGNKGLQIELLSGKKVLIGTNKAEELELVINQLKEGTEKED
jgi:hypothetical protein